MGIDLPIRGLKEGFGTPLQDFWGTLDSVTQKNDEKFKKLRVTFNFKDIKVIKSSEPYNFPIAPIDVNYSEHKKSNWGILANSLVKLMPETENIPWLQGKRLHMVLTPGHNFGKDKQTGLDMIRDCWEVIEIEGVAGKINPEERLLEILDGKTDIQFNQVALADPVLKQSADIMNALVGQTLLPALVEKGLAKKDENGVWRRIKKA